MRGVAETGRSSNLTKKAKSVSTTPGGLMQLLSNSTANPQRRCATGKCNACFTCVDNAKWERIFNEKFADPDYYRAPQSRNGSTLSGYR
jgi:hypothetical protein